MFSLHNRNKTKLTRVVTPSKAMQDKLNDSPCPRSYPKVYKLRTISKPHYKVSFMCVGRELFLGMTLPNPQDAKVACLMLSLTSR